MLRSHRTCAKQHRVQQHVLIKCGAVVYHPTQQLKKTETRKKTGVRERPQENDAPQFVVFVGESAAAVLH
jgi:hypothetical protein